MRFRDKSFICNRHAIVRTQTNVQFLVAKTMQLTLAQRKILHPCKGSCWLAKIDLGDKRPIRSCVVLEMTGSGTRLAAGFAADAPDIFFLLLSTSGNVGRRKQHAATHRQRTCRLICARQCPQQQSNPGRSKRRQRESLHRLIKRNEVKAVLRDCDLSNERRTL